MPVSHMSLQRIHFGAARDTPLISHHTANPTTKPASRQCAYGCVCVPPCLTTWGQKRYSDCPSLAFVLPLFDCRPQQMFSIREPGQLPLTRVDTLFTPHSYFLLFWSRATHNLVMRSVITVSIRILQRQPSDYEKPSADDAR